MAKKATPADDDQVDVDDELDVEKSEGEGEDEGEETPPPKPKPKSAPKADAKAKGKSGDAAKPAPSKSASTKGGKAKASAKAEPEEDEEESDEEEEESDEEEDGDEPSGFTAEEYEEFQELKKKLGGLDLDKIKKNMSEAEREKARLNAQRKAAERRARDAEADKAAAEEEMREKIASLESKWADSEKRAAEKELGSVVDAYSRGLTFVGATPDLQRAAGSNFAEMARRSLKAEYDEDTGEIIVTGAKDGKPASVVLKALAEKHAYLIARKAKPGPTNPGGNIPPSLGDDSENATEAALAAIRARRRR